MIVETDGSMIPIVETTCTDKDGNHIDRRKTRTLSWKEARLSVATEKKGSRKTFEAVIGNTDLAGKHMAHCAIQAGVCKNTYVHSVGDGAFWIEEQVDRFFGNQCNYLIDFYHLCEYLSGAASQIALVSAVSWVEDQKKKLLENRVDELILELRQYLDANKIYSNKNPVWKCHNYLINRIGQFNYRDALASNLPIGSGEIESAHRYVIQERLKIAGAWWRKDKAQSMIALRVMRENQNWDTYWKERKFNKLKLAA